MNRYQAIKGAVAGILAASFLLANAWAEKLKKDMPAAGVTATIQGAMGHDRGPQKY